MNDQSVSFLELLEACRTHDLETLQLAYGIGTHDLDALNGAVNGPTPVERGQILCPEGRPCDALYAVRNGSFKSYVTDEDGNSQVTGFRFTGELLGLDALFDGKHHSTSMALESSYVYRIDSGQLNNVIRVAPGLQDELLRLISRRIREDEHHMLLIAQKTAPERLATYLLHVNERQNGHGNSQTLYLPMSRDDLANFLGFAAETLSRLLARFKDNGMIAIPDRKHLELLELAPLGKIAGFQPG